LEQERNFWEKRHRAAAVTDAAKTDKGFICRKVFEGAEGENNYEREIFFDFLFVMACCNNYRVYDFVIANARSGAPV
jgi:hypothetical protein